MNKVLCFFLWGLIFLPALVSAQETIVKGTLKDSDTNEGLPFTTIHVKGLNQGTTTNERGEFTLKTSQGFPVTLLITAVGYERKEVVVQQSTIDIVLSPSNNQLDDVVVVGYGTQRKRDITGSIVQLKTDELNDRPVFNVVQAMQGKASGVDISSNIRPGGIGQIRIRGNRSINASNEPLYVIDGIPVSADEANAINPKDIASIEILKDASATAIYGSRGANGVVLISYKEGKKGKVTVSYDGSVSFDRIHSTTSWMNSGELLDYQRQAHINGGTYTGKYGTAPDPDFDVQQYGGGEVYGINSIKNAYQWNADGSVALRNATPAEIANGYAAQVPVYTPGNLLNQNWPDLVTRTGAVNNHSLSLASGTDKSRLFISMGYLNQKGAMIDQDYNRYSLNIKGDVSPRKWITVGAGLNGFYGIQNYGMAENYGNSGGKDSYSQALALLPYAPAFDDNGNILNTTGSGLSAHNVLLNINNATNEHKQYAVLANTFADIRFTPWLKYNVKLGAQINARENGSFYSTYYTNPFSSVGTAPLIGYNAHSKRFSYVLENLLTFNKEFGVHRTQIDVLQSIQENTSNGINIRAQKITFPTSLWYNLSANDVGIPMSYGTNYSRTGLASFMARFNYGFSDKYLLTATGRWDGASVLAEGHKFDFFPSLALGWNLDREAFLSDVNWLDQLKLRFGVGVTGNSSVSAYSTTGSIIAANYIFGETQYPGYKSAVMPNANLGWEKTRQYNLGLDFSGLKGKISGSVELYQADTKDLLLSRSIPPVLGYNSVLVNIGKTQNRGIEVSLTTENIKRKDFVWNTTFTWSANREKIVELTDGKTDDVASGWFIGNPVSVFRDYAYDRIWSTSDADARLIELYKKIGNITALPGQVKIKDQQLIEVSPDAEGAKSVTLNSGEIVTYLDNGFGTINDDDKRILGSNRPKWYGGITNSFAYKNFELSFFLYARVGNMYYGASQTLGRRAESDIWSVDNQDAQFPQPTTATFTNYNYVRNYTSGSLLALRYISLSYKLPQTLLDKWNVGSVQIYSQILNPFIWGGEAVKVGLNPDDVNGWDNLADAQRGGQSSNTVLVKSFVLGLRLGI